MDFYGSLDSPASCADRRIPDRATCSAPNGWSGKTGSNSPACIPAAIAGEIRSAFHRTNDFSDSTDGQPTHSDHGSGFTAADQAGSCSHSRTGIWRDRGIACGYHGFCTGWNAGNPGWTGYAARYVSFSTGGFAIAGDSTGSSGSSCSCVSFIAAEPTFRGTRAWHIERSNNWFYEYD